MPFTDYKIQRMKAPKVRRIITETGVPPDLRGLQLWLYPTGSKVFMLRYKTAGRSRYMTLGAYPTVTLAEAHQKVQAHRAQLRQGIDPVSEREATKQANRSAPTVQVLFEDFRDHYLRHKRKRPAEAEAILENHILPKWKERKARLITRREIIERIRSLAEDNGPRIAEVTKGLVGQMFGYAVDTGLLENSPAVRIPVIGSRGEQRERTLTDDQIKTFWNAPINAMPQIRAALRLLLATGQRRQEVSLAKWEHIDRKAKVWTIPPENSKNGKAHAVPLSRLALDVLDELGEAGRRKHKDGTVSVSAYVVPSRLVEDQPIEPLALTRAVRNNKEVYGFEFTPHDLRRSAASGMAALGTSRLVVGKVLNHADDSVTAIYDRHDYAEEKRQALDTWAAHLAGVIAGKKSKVMPINKKQRQRKAG